jgi:hypothetical protein
MTKDELMELREIASNASDYFEMCPLNWRVQETGAYSYEKYEETKEANMKFSKTFGPRLVKKLIDEAFQNALNKEI